MSNIIHHDFQIPCQTPRERDKNLLQCFAVERRGADDVFWLKENAELLNVLESTGMRPDPEALSAYDGFYTEIEKRLEFFPQYYRFLLSICLDLEDLGYDGNKGAALVEWVARQGVAQAEMSDLQRMEARRLMMRRGVDPLADDVGLEGRVRGFIQRSQTFAMPNKKAAYELTHAVFYLSEYGRKDPKLNSDARTSLEFAGLLAFLEQNADLLAEVCIALSYAGFETPKTWQDWLERHTQRFGIEELTGTNCHDHYHEFLMCNWMTTQHNSGGFEQPIASGGLLFRSPNGGAAGPLKELSECIFRMDIERSSNWGVMRPIVLEQLSDSAQVVLTHAEDSCAAFDAFFKGFARREFNHKMIV